MQKDLKKIIKKCRTKDEEARKELYHLCFDRLMKICTRYHNNRQDAIALLHEGFLKILVNLESYDARKDFFPWMSTIMIRTAIDQYRKTKNYRTVVELHENVAESVFAVEELWVYNDVITRLEWAEVNEMLHSLPEPEKVVFNLFEMEGYSHREIAFMMGISERSSKRYLHAAKARLKAMLQKKEEIKKVV